MRADEKEEDVGALRLALAAATRKRARDKRALTDEIADLEDALETERMAASRRERALRRRIDEQAEVIEALRAVLDTFAPPPAPQAPEAQARAAP